MRSEEEIDKAREELFDKVWYERHLVLKYEVEEGLETVDPEVWQRALAKAEEIRNKYPEDELVLPGPEEAAHFEWGRRSGQLETLRWVLGDDWGFLDT